MRLFPALVGSVCLTLTFNLFSCSGREGGGKEANNTRNVDNPNVDSTATPKIKIAPDNGYVSLQRFNANLMTDRALRLYDPYETKRDSSLVKSLQDRFYALDALTLDRLKRWEVTVLFEDLTPTTPALDSGLSGVCYDGRTVRLAASTDAKAALNALVETWQRQEAPADATLRLHQGEKKWRKASTTNPQQKNGADFNDNPSLRMI